MVLPNGNGKNCEAVNGVKFVKIHFSSVDAVRMTKTAGMLPRRDGRPNLLNINYHPGGHHFISSFRPEQVSTHRARFIIASLKYVCVSNGKCRVFKYSLTDNSIRPCRYSLSFFTDHFAFPQKSKTKMMPILIPQKLFEV